MLEQEIQRKVNKVMYTMAKFRLNDTQTTKAFDLIYNIGQCETVEESEELYQNWYKGINGFSRFYSKVPKWVMLLIITTLLIPSAGKYINLIKELEDFKETIIEITYDRAISSYVTFVDELESLCNKSAGRNDLLDLTYFPELEELFVSRYNQRGKEMLVYVEAIKYGC